MPVKAFHHRPSSALFTPLSVPCHRIYSTSLESFVLQFFAQTGHFLSFRRPCDLNVTAPESLLQPLCLFMVLGALSAPVRDLIYFLVSHWILPPPFIVNTQRQGQSFSHICDHCLSLSTTYLFKKFQINEWTVYFLPKLDLQPARQSIVPIFPSSACLQISTKCISSWDFVWFCSQLHKNYSFWALPHR